MADGASSEYWSSMAVISSPDSGERDRRRRSQTTASGPRSPEYTWTGPAVDAWSHASDLANYLLGVFRRRAGPGTPPGSEQQWRQARRLAQYRLSALSNKSPKALAPTSVTWSIVR